MANEDTIAKTYTKHLAESMGETKLRVMSEVFKNYIEYVVEGQDEKWVVVKKYWGKTKEVIAQYKTKTEAEAVLKIINFTEGK